MSEQEKKPAAVSTAAPATDEVRKAEEDLKKAKAELDTRLEEMEKEFDRRREQLEKEYEEKKAVMLRDMEAARVMAEDEFEELRSQTAAHKKEIICGVSIAAVVALLTALLCGHGRHSRR